MTPFLLRIDFTGISVFAMHPNGRRMGVVMPDARWRKGKMWHPDGTSAVAHAGYLRIDAANLRGVEGLPAGDGSDAPPHELVYRFSGQDVDFGVEHDNSPLVGTLAIPDFDTIAPVKELRPKVFSDEIPRGVSMRCILPGGRLSTEIEPGEWTITGELRPDGHETRSAYGGVSSWERTIDAESVVITLRDFRTRHETRIPLVPKALPDGTLAVLVKVANLCAINPMEWQELEIREVRVPDVDFKWLYQLLVLREDKDPIEFPSSLLPHPHPIIDDEQGIIVDCFPAKIQAAF